MDCAQRQHGLENNGLAEACFSDETGPDRAVEISCKAWPGFEAVEVEAEALKLGFEMQERGIGGVQWTFGGTDERMLKSLMGRAAAAALEEGRQRASGGISRLLGR